MGERLSNIFGVFVALFLTCAMAQPETPLRYEGLNPVQQVMVQSLKRTVLFQERSAEEKLLFSTAQDLKTFFFMLERLGYVNLPSAHHLEFISPVVSSMVSQAGQALVVVPNLEVQRRVQSVFASKPFIKMKVKVVSYSDFLFNAGSLYTSVTYPLVVYFSGHRLSGQESKGLKKLQEMKESLQVVLSSAPRYSDDKQLSNVLALQINETQKIKDHVQSGALASYRNLLLVYKDIDLSAAVNPQTQEVDEQKLNTIFKALGHGKITKPIIQGYLNLRNHTKYKKAEVFCQGIDHAIIMAEQFNKVGKALEQQGTVGFKAAAVHSNLSKEQRHQIYQDYASGKIQVLTGDRILLDKLPDPKTEMVFTAVVESSPVYAQLMGEKALAKDATNPSKIALILNLVYDHPNKTPLKQILFGDVLESPESYSSFEIEQKAKKIIQSLPKMIDPVATFLKEIKDITPMYAKVSRLNVEINHTKTKIEKAVSTRTRINHTLSKDDFVNEQVKKIIEGIQVADHEDLLKLSLNTEASEDEFKIVKENTRMKLIFGDLSEEIIVEILKVFCEPSKNKIGYFNFRQKEGSLEKFLVNIKNKNEGWLSSVRISVGNSLGNKNPKLLEVFQNVKKKIFMQTESQNLFKDLKEKNFLKDIFGDLSEEKIQEILWVMSEPNSVRVGDFLFKQKKEALDGLLQTIEQKEAGWIRSVRQSIVVSLGVKSPKLLEAFQNVQKKIFMQTESQNLFKDLKEKNFLKDIFGDLSEEKIQEILWVMSEPNSVRVGGFLFKQKKEALDGLLQTIEQKEAGWTRSVRQSVEQNLRSSKRQDLIKAFQSVYKTQPIKHAPSVSDGKQNDFARNKTNKFYSPEYKPSDSSDPILPLSKAALSKPIEVSKAIVHSLLKRVSAEILIWNREQYHPTSTQENFKHMICDLKSLAEQLEKNEDLKNPEDLVLKIEEALKMTRTPFSEISGVTKTQYAIVPSNDFLKNEIRLKIEQMDLEAGKITKRTEPLKTFKTTKKEGFPRSKPRPRGK